MVHLTGSLLFVGRFIWRNVEGYYIPCLIRIIKNERQYFVAMKIAQSDLLMSYLKHLHPEIYEYLPMPSYFINEAEAKVLNELNQKFADEMYGKKLFLSGEDKLIRFDDLVKFYEFLKFCYKKLVNIGTPDRRDICGFIRINSDAVVPYCLKEDQKYLPLVYFDGQIDGLRQRAIKLEKCWSLAYLKFCCRVQGILSDFFFSNSCVVVTLEEVKKYLSPETCYQEYWPSQIIDLHLLTNYAYTRTSNPQAHGPNKWTSPEESDGTFPAQPSFPLHIQPIASATPVIVAPPGTLENGKNVECTTSQMVRRLLLL